MASKIVKCVMKSVIKSKGNRLEVRCSIEDDYIIVSRTKWSIKIASIEIVGNLLTVQRIGKIGIGSEIWLKPAVATFLYGAAHGEGRSLDTIRRELGYFKRNVDGNQWVGSLQSETLQPKPDEGPPRAVPRKGVVVVGATQWVENYNVPIFLTDMAVVRRIAKRISGKDGGLPSVQSMALAHGKGMIEVDCNLLDTSKASGEDVQRAVECLAREEGMDVGEGYYTDLSQNQTKFICFFDVVYGDVEAGLELRGTREARGRR
ncbi:uncharacterized protein LOC131005074 [Salvia miltiorrhiza]|uniref:uncharacterized protein LOC131005074 n=1 Tax=Salvia miltiorrhiza TaxID=226208 RepID=UPI0025AD3AE0|nr:uncharacterized protein LOC131005074 [Salvia miltiorrhiza]